MTSPLDEKARLTEDNEALREALSEGLDLCERARKMDAMEKERAEMYLRNPDMTRSATIPLWAEEQYQRDLAEWEARAKQLMPFPLAPGRATLNSREKADAPSE